MRAVVVDEFGGIAWFAEGGRRVNIAGGYPLERAAEAFEALETRRRAGKLLLTH